MKTFEIFLLGILTIFSGRLTISKAEVKCFNPPPHTDLKSCCQINDFITEEIRTKCEAETKSYMPENEEEGDYFGPPGGKHHGPGGHPRGHHGLYHHCFKSCVLNETGILIDGEFQEDNLNAYLNQIYDDSEIVAFIGEEFRKCNEKREKIVMKKPINRHAPLPCPHNHGHMLLGCTFIHSFKHCPDSVWSNTDECNAVREHFRECGPPHHHKHDENNEEIDDADDEAEEEI